MSKRYTTRYGNPGRGGGGRRRGQPPTGVRPLSYGTVSRSERDSSYGGHLARSLGMGNERARNSGAPAIFPEDCLNMVGPDVLSLVATLSVLQQQQPQHNVLQHGDTCPQWQNSGEFHGFVDDPTFHEPGPIDQYPFDSSSSMAHAHLDRPGQHFHFQPRAASFATDVGRREPSLLWDSSSACRSEVPDRSFTQGPLLERDVGRPPLGVPHVGRDARRSLLGVPHAGRDAGRPPLGVSHVGRHAGRPPLGVPHAGRDAGRPSLAEASHSRQPYPSSRSHPPPPFGFSSSDYPHGRMSPVPPHVNASHPLQLEVDEFLSHRHRSRRGSSPNIAGGPYSPFQYSANESGEPTHYIPSSSSRSQPRDGHPFEPRLTPNSAPLPVDDRQPWYPDVHPESSFPQRREEGPNHESYIDLCSEDEVHGGHGSGGYDSSFFRRNRSPSPKMTSSPYRGSLLNREGERSHHMTREIPRKASPSHLPDGSRIRKASSLSKDGRSLESFRSNDGGKDKHQPTRSEGRSRLKGERGGPLPAVSSHLHQRSSSYDGERHSPRASSTVGSLRKAAGSVMERLGPETSSSSALGFLPQEKHRSASPARVSSRSGNIESRLGPAPNSSDSAPRSDHSNALYHGRKPSSKVNPLVTSTRGRSSPEITMEYSTSVFASRSTGVSARPPAPSTQHGLLPGSKRSHIASSDTRRNSPDLRVEARSASPVVSSRSSTPPMGHSLKGPRTYSKKLPAEVVKTKGHSGGSSNHYSVASLGKSMPWAPPRDPSVSSSGKSTSWGLVGSARDPSLSSFGKSMSRGLVGPPRDPSVSSSGKSTSWSLVGPARDPSLSSGKSTSWGLVDPARDPRFERPPSRDPRHQKPSPHPSRDPRLDRPPPSPSKDGRDQKPSPRPSTVPRHQTSSPRPSTDPRHQQLTPAKYTSRRGEGDTLNAVMASSHSERSHSSSSSRMPHERTKTPPAASSLSLRARSKSEDSASVNTSTGRLAAPTDRVHTTGTDGLSDVIIITDDEEEVDYSRRAIQREIAAVTLLHSDNPTAGSQAHGTSLPITYQVSANLPSETRYTHSAMPTQMFGSTHAQHHPRELAKSSTEAQTVAIETKPLMEIATTTQPTKESNNSSAPFPAKGGSSPIPQVQTGESPHTDAVPIPALMDIQVTRPERKDTGHVVPLMDIQAAETDTMGERVPLQGVSVMDSEPRMETAVEVEVQTTEAGTEPVEVSTFQPRREEAKPVTDLEMSEHETIEKAIVPLMEVQVAGVEIKEGGLEDMELDSEFDSDSESDDGRLVIDTSDITEENQMSAVESATPSKGGTMQWSIPPVTVTKGRSAHSKVSSVQNSQPSQHTSASPQVLRRKEFGKIQKLAARVLGREMVVAMSEKLQTHGLSELYQSISNVHNFCAKPSRKQLYLSYVDIVTHIGKHFRNYAICSVGQTISEDGLPSLKIVFMSEVKHLFGVCGNDIELWGRKISEFKFLCRCHLKSSHVLKQRPLPSPVPPDSVNEPSFKDHHLLPNDPQEEMQGSLSKKQPPQPTVFEPLSEPEPSENVNSSRIDKQEDHVVEPNVEPTAIPDSLTEPDNAAMPLCGPEDPRRAIPLHSLLSSTPDSFERQEGVSPVSLSSRTVYPSGFEGPIGANIETLKSVERQLESEIQHFERQIQNEVRNFEHAQPLAVESYDYGHKSTASVPPVEPTQSSETFPNMDVCKDSLSSTVHSQTQPALADADEDQSASSNLVKQPTCERSTVEVEESEHHSLRRSLSPGEIVSPSPPSTPTGHLASKNFYFQDKPTTGDVQHSLEKENVSTAHATTRKSLSDGWYPEGTVRQGESPPPSQHFFGHSDRLRTGGHSYAHRHKALPTRGRSPARRRARSRSRSRSASPAPTRGRSPARRRARSRSHSPSASLARSRRRRSPSPQGARRHSHRTSSRLYRHRSLSRRRSGSCSPSPSYPDSKTRRSQQSSTSPTTRRSRNPYSHVRRRSRSRSPATRVSGSHGRGHVLKQHHFSRSLSHSPEPRQKHKGEKTQVRRVTGSGSDEELELLELRKDALISMIKGDEDAGLQVEGVDQEAKGNEKGMETISGEGFDQMQPVKGTSQATTISQPSSSLTTGDVGSNRTPSHGEEKIVGSVAKMDAQASVPSVDRYSQSAEMKPTDSDGPTSKPSASESEVSAQKVMSAAVPSVPDKSMNTCTRTSVLPKTTSTVAHATVTKHSEPPSGAASAISTALPKAVMSLKAGVGDQGTSRSGSCYSSRTPSPTPSPSPSVSRSHSRPPGGNVQDSLQLGSPPRRSSLSVKIVASDTMTWEIPVCRIEVSDGESATETDSETESSSDSAQPMAVGSDRAEDGQSSRRVSGKQIDDVLSQIRRAAEAKAKARTTEPSQPSEPVSGVPSATLQVLEQKTESAASQTRGADQQSPQVQPMPSPEIKIPMPPDALPLDKQKEYLELRRKLALHEKRLQKQKGVRVSQPKVDNAGSKGKGKGTGKKKTAFGVSKATASATPSTTPPLVEPPAPLAVQALGKAKLPGKGTSRPTPTAEKPSNKTKAKNKQTQKQQSLLLEKQRAREEQARKRIDEYNQLIRTSRSQLESEQADLTALTNQLTECESEIEESELKVELLRKQLKLAEEKYDQCKQRRSALQAKVRSVKIEVSKHNSVIRETQQRLELEEKTLTKATCSTAVISSSTPSANSSTAVSTAAVVTEKLTKPLPVPEYESISDAEATDPKDTFTPAIERVEGGLQNMGFHLTVPLLGLRTEPVSDPEDTVGSALPRAPLPVSPTKGEKGVLFASISQPDTCPEAAPSSSETQAQSMVTQPPTAEAATASTTATETPSSTLVSLSSVQVARVVGSESEEEEIDVVGSPVQPEVSADRVSEEVTSFEGSAQGTTCSEEQSGSRGELAEGLSGSLSSAFDLSLEKQAPSLVQLENLSAALSKLGQLASKDADSLVPGMSEEVIGNAIDEALNKTLAGQQVTEASVLLESVLKPTVIATHANGGQVRGEVPQTTSPPGAVTAVTTTSQQEVHWEAMVWKEHSYSRTGAIAQNLSAGCTTAAPGDNVEVTCSTAELREVSFLVEPYSDSDVPSTENLGDVVSAMRSRKARTVRRRRSLPSLNYREPKSSDVKQSTREVKKPDRRKRGAPKRKCKAPKRHQKQSQSRFMPAVSLSLDHALCTALSPQLASLLSPDHAQRTIQRLEKSYSFGPHSLFPKSRSITSEQGSSVSGVCPLPCTTASVAESASSVATQNLSASLSTSSTISTNAAIKSSIGVVSTVDSISHVIPAKGSGQARPKRSTHTSHLRHAPDKRQHLESVSTGSFTGSVSIPTATVGFAASVGRTSTGVVQTVTTSCVRQPISSVVAPLKAKPSFSTPISSGIRTVHTEVSTPTPKTTASLPLGQISSTFPTQKTLAPHNPRKLYAATPSSTTLIPSMLHAKYPTSSGSRETTPPTVVPDALFEVTDERSSYHVPAIVDLEIDPSAISDEAIAALKEAQRQLMLQKAKEEPLQHGEYVLAVSSSSKAHSTSASTDLIAQSNASTTDTVNQYTIAEEQPRLVVTGDHSITTVYSVQTQLVPEIPAADNALRKAVSTEGVRSTSESDNVGVYGGRGGRINRIAETLQRQQTPTTPVCRVLTGDASCTTEAPACTGTASGPLPVPAIVSPSQVATPMHTSAVVSRTSVSEEENMDKKHQVTSERRKRKQTEALQCPVQVSTKPSLVIAATGITTATTTTPSVTSSLTGQTSSSGLTGLSSSSTGLTGSSKSVTQWKLQGFSAQVQDLQGELFRLEQRRKNLPKQLPGTVEHAKREARQSNTVENGKPSATPSVELRSSESRQHVPSSESTWVSIGNLGGQQQQSAGKLNVLLRPGNAGERKRGPRDDPTCSVLPKRQKLDPRSQAKGMVEGKRRHDAVLVSALKELGVNVTSEQLDHMYVDSPGLEVAVRISEPLCPTLGLDGILKKMFSSINFTVPEAVLSSVEKLEKQKEENARDQLAQSSSAQGVSGYTPYLSPLLHFRSYRLSPFYRTQAKLPISSPSMSHKIDPRRIMCRYELHGICNDAKCSAQHLKDIRPSKQELLENLIAYAPTLVGCSPESLQIADRGTPELKRDLSRRICSYASTMLQTYHGKITDEQLYILTVHQVNQERLKQNSHVPCSFVTCQEWHWLLSPEEVGRVRRLDYGTDRSQVQRSTTADVDVSASEGRSRSTVGAVETLGEGEQLSALPPRYFPSDKAALSRPPTSVEDTGDLEKPTIEVFLRRSQKARERGNLVEAKQCLESGLQLHQSSEELLVEWMRASSAELMGRVQSIQTYLEDLDGVCTRALAASQHPAVTFECVRLARTYEAKQRYLVEGVTALSCQARSDETSHFSLELLLNLVQLDYLSGRPELAARKLSSALLPNREPSARSVFPFSSTSVLTEGDLVFACLCCVYLEYCGTLPQAIFHPSSCHPPFRIATKEPFAIPWQESRQLTQKEYTTLGELVRGFVSLCSPESPGPASHLPRNVTQLSLPLYQNLITFESTHGVSEATRTELCLDLLSADPALPELWLTCAWVEREKEESWRMVIERGVRGCGGLASELYYFAARQELRQAHQETPECVGRALRWLRRCVLQFYRLQDANLTLPQTLMLYRKLLGLLVPYDYSFPDFAEGVQPKHHLGDQLLSLWLCYCLMVELTLPSVAPGDFHPASMEDLFEAAVHSVRDTKAMRRLWLEYLSFLRAQLMAGGGTYQHFKALSDCVQRSLVALETCCTHQFPVYGQPNQFDRYTFHNEVMELFLSCMPIASGYRLKVLQRFVDVFPRNTRGVLWLVWAALEQSPSEREQAQDVLAAFLAREPRSLSLWRLAISAELQQSHIREARWMYLQAVKALPFHAQLWKEFLQFEMCNSSSFTTIAEVLKMARNVGIDLASLFREHLFV